MLLTKLSRPVVFKRHYSLLPHQYEIIDWEYFTNPNNFSAIVSNVTSRKVPFQLGDFLEKLHQLGRTENNSPEANALKDSLFPKLLWFPNVTHPKVLENKSEDPLLLQKVGQKQSFTFFPTNFNSLTKRLNVLRHRNLGNMAGDKSYFLKNDLAHLEHALVRFSLRKLRERGFQLVSVPDILPKSFIEKCGMQTDHKNSQVYQIANSWSPNDVCLSGTAEMALASLFSECKLNFSQFPLKLCAASRCYRAEAGRGQKEKGIFRVHCFNKVEMFGITGNETGEESEALLEEFTTLQKEIFTDLGLHFKILEMPPCDLGLPAYHKIDMEAWIPTQKLYGEISSASNCTDYQARRIGLKYTSDSGQTKFCHTVNATACAIPRLLITMFENFQNLDGSINIPEPLKVYMKKDTISGKFKESILCTKPIP